MNRQNPGQMKAGLAEPKQSEEELREKGMRLLAAIICRKYLRDIQRSDGDFKRPGVRP